MSAVAIAPEYLLTTNVVLLSLAAMAFLWVCACAPRLLWLRPKGIAPVTFPADGMPALPSLEGWGNENDRDRLAGILADQLRHPGSRDVSDLPPAMLVAMLILGAAVDRPAGMDDDTARMLAWAHRHHERPARMGMPGKRILQAIEDASKGHAWWDTAAVELMVRARAAGSWLTPHDLRFLARDEPALLAALSAGPAGTVSPDGAGILAHHSAERTVRTRLPDPYPDPALCFLINRLIPRVAS